MARGIIAVGVTAIVVVAAIIGISVFAMNGDDTDKNNQQSAQTAEKQQPNTIVDAASANENFSTLVTAVKAADLTGALSGEAKLTVFAPSNDAFAKLPAGTVDTLLKPESKEQLASILTYHVVEGAVMSNQLTNGQKIKTLNSAELTVSIENGSVYIVDAKGGKAMVTQPDIKVDNGVIHAIDAVLMPAQ